MKRFWGNFSRKLVLEYAIYMIAFYLLFRAEVMKAAPFALAFFASLILLKRNGLILFPIYILAGFLATFDFSNLMYIAVEGLILTLAYMLHIFLRRDLKLIYVVMYVLLARGFYMLFYMVPITSNEIILRVCDSVAASVFACAFSCGLRALIVRGLRFNSTVDENLSLALLLVALYRGTLGLYLWGVNISFSIGVLLCLTAVWIFGAGGTLVAAALGLSYLIYNGDPRFLAAFCLYSASAAIFKDVNRFIPPLAVLFTELILSYFFGLYTDYSYLNIISIALGCGAYLCVPKFILNHLKDLFAGVSGNTLSRYIANRSKLETGRKIAELSDVFKEMELVYQSLIFGQPDKDADLKAIADDLREETCMSCPVRKRCYESEDGASAHIEELLLKGMQKRKVSLVDIDTCIASRCVKVNSMLQNANRLLEIYRQNKLAARNIDNSKELIARQMGAVSKILSELSGETGKKVIFNLKLEKQLLDEFSLRNIVCSEVMISGQRYEDLQVSAVLYDRDAKRADLADVVGRVCGMRMMAVMSERAEKSGFTVITLKPVPKYDVTFGVSGETKAGMKKSGDTHSLLQISEDKFVLCLCDGMGSGERAEQISNAAISLVENFYQAGFSGDVILSTVNKLLAYVGEDTFAALDIAGVNLKDGLCDFIKIGAPESFLKRKGEVLKFEGSSLPLGILEDITPWSESVRLKDGDLIILLTDGVRECFGTPEKLREFIYRSAGLNPKLLADSIIEEAATLAQGYPPDDMTALVCKIFERYRPEAQ